MVEHPKISVIILCRNQLDLIKQTIKVLKKQVGVGDVEIIMMDTSSTDGTKEFLHEEKITVVNIPKEEFGYGKTFNLGWRQSSGKYVVRLSGDAVPKDKYFLQNMASGFKNPEVVASYGLYVLPKNTDKVLPTSWPTKRFPKESTICNYKPSFLLIKEMISVNRMKKLTNLAGGAACFRRSILEKRSLNERTFEAEDAEYAAYINHLGKYISYSAEAEVYHGHEKRKWTIQRVIRNLKISGILIPEIYRVHFQKMLGKL